MSRPAAKGKFIEPGSIVGNNIIYDDFLKKDDYPETPLNSMDYSKRLRFEELKRTRLEAMCDWK